MTILQNLLNTPLSRVYGFRWDFTEMTAYKLMATSDSYNMYAPEKIKVNQDFPQSKPKGCPAS